MEIMYLSDSISVMLSDHPVGVGDVCSGPEIPDQPNEATVAMLVDERRQ